MTSVALALVLVAAVLHPTWNLLAKRATGGDAIAFVWLTSALSTGLYVPFVVGLVLVAHVRLPSASVDGAMILGTGVLHVVYFALLQRGYRAGDFSVVYPLARGSAPVFAASAAIALFGERLDLVQCAGVALVVLAIVVITRRSVDGRATVARSATHATRASLGYGLATGLAIAAYTLWDKQAVSMFAISPILYDFGRTVAQTAILAPAVFTSDARRTSLRSTWTAFRREAIGVAVLSPLAYVLVLYALTSAPVSVVAPLRESSIVIGAFMGARLLREGRPGRRIVASAVMLAGIVALARG